MTVGNWKDVFYTLKRYKHEKDPKRRGVFTVVWMCITGQLRTAVAKRTVAAWCLTLSASAPCQIDWSVWRLAGATGSSKNLFLSTCQSVSHWIVMHRQAGSQSVSLLLTAANLANSGPVAVRCLCTFKQNVSASWFYCVQENCWQARRIDKWRNCPFRWITKWRKATGKGKKAVTFLQLLTQSLPSPVFCCLLWFTSSHCTRAVLSSINSEEHSVERRTVWIQNSNNIFKQTSYVFC